jgi:hypothetical protein
MASNLAEKIVAEKRSRRYFEQNTISNHKATLASSFSMPSCHKPRISQLQVYEFNLLTALG